MKQWGLLMMMLATPALAAARPDGAQLLNDLRKLEVVGTVLYVAAHPDDENTRLLAMFANETKVRAAYLSFTRGEGGQNLIGSELGPLLGVIRTQELLAARRTDGAEQFFTRARDFGYSKSVDETLAIWDHDRVLADAVYVIRLIRPDVIVTRFALEGGDTHGHHTASARLALEAFTAAADPKYQPEMLQPWQATRIVWNAWTPDGSEKLPPGTVQLDSSPFNPLLGMTWGELAADSRSQHKSQGFGAAPVHGSSVENFVPLGGKRATKSIFDGIDLSWKRVPGSEKLSALLAKANAEFKVDAPSKSVPVLVEALTELRKLPKNSWTEKKTKELSALVVSCAGLFLEATVANPTVVAGQKIEVKATALLRSDAPVQSLTRGKATETTAVIDTSAPHTTYWLRNEPNKGTWSLDANHTAEQPEEAVAEHTFKLTIAGQPIEVTRPVVFKWTDPTMGERTRPVEVLPPVVLKPSVDLLAFTDASAKDLDVTVTAIADAQSGAVSLEVPEGVTVEPKSASFSIAKKKGTQVVRFKVKGRASGSLMVVATIGGATFNQSLTRIDYPHIPMQTLLFPAKVKVIHVDLKRGKTKRVGYIAGAGDDVPAALRQVGYEVTRLSDEQLKSAPLDGYDAIVIGIRAYNVNPSMPAIYPRLMQYVNAGGTLVAQYNTKNWLSDVPAEMGPFPFEIGRDRVTNEEAVPTMEKHRVFQSPNVITDADWSNWVQERGLYFATKIDAKYETPLSLADPNEPASKGALIIAKYGKGRFIYTGLAFFRQLPAGVPGAYRLFANLIDRGS